VAQKLSEVSNLCKCLFMSTVKQPEFLTLGELALYLRVSRTTAYQLVTTGKVPAVKVGGQWRIPRMELERQLSGTTA
jgi:excisionase family DNA binding protein